ncbi:neutral zinc metallopeptidase [Ramlibacter sp. AW1]|uniref:Neutral zinc metallopeptidase n=1 Tax=Ramlibacter aurantiacus TaxID=2801330 RepID=A0A937D5P7_9BURK|nr:neutral zinc metallopeptidase [Ramlibacter aurantiacus]
MWTRWALGRQSAVGRCRGPPLQRRWRRLSRGRARHQHRRHRGGAHRRCGRARQVAEQGDGADALNAAARIGDDALQPTGGGAVVPESFTHGTSRQPSRGFDAGLRTGGVRACDTFAPGAA